MPEWLTSIARLAGKVSPNLPFPSSSLGKHGHDASIFQPLSREKSRTFPRPAHPCLQSSHPAEGYAARRGSQAGSALAVREGRRPSPEGPAENGLPPATRGKRQGIGPPCRFTPRTARRMCLCGTQGGWLGGCVGIVRRDGSSPERRQTPFRRQGPQGEVLRGEKSDRPIPETGGRHPRIAAFAEGPESQAKTAERGAERCHIYFFIRGSFQRPVRYSQKTHGRKIRRVDSGIGRAFCVAQPVS